MALRAMGVHSTRVINWVRPKGEKLPDSIVPENIPDKLEAFEGSKKCG